MTTTVAHVPEAQRFEVEVDGTLAGFAAYRRSGREVIFTHTEVLPAYQNRGVASALVRGALDQVRSEGLEVVPLCSYVKTWIGRHPDYADLVHPPRTD